MIHRCSTINFSIEMGIKGSKCWDTLFMSEKRSTINFYSTLNEKGMFSVACHPIVHYIEGISANQHMGNRLSGMSECRHCFMSKKRDYSSNNDMILDLFWTSLERTSL